MCGSGFGKWFWVCICFSIFRLKEVLWTHDLISQSLVSLVWIFSMFRQWTWTFVNCICVCFIPCQHSNTIHQGSDWVGFGRDYFGVSFEVSFLPLTWHPHGLLGDLLRWRRRVHQLVPCPWKDAPLQNVCIDREKLLQVGPCYAKYKGSGSGSNIEQLYSNMFFKGCNIA